MNSRLIEGMQEDVARELVKIHERTTQLAREVGALGKAIEILSSNFDSKEFDVGYFGGIIHEKSDEIFTLIDDFVSYPTIYLALNEGKKRVYNVCN